MGVKTINLAPMIRKELSKEDIINDKVIPETVDSQNEIIEPTIDNASLKALRNSSIYHRKCLKAVAEDVTKNGWEPQEITDNPTEANRERLTLLFDDYNNNEALFNVMLDFRTYTHAAYEILRDPLGEIKGFKHIRANTVRMCKGGEKAIQQVGSTKVYFKVYGKRIDEDLHYKTGQWGQTDSIMEENKATEIVWINSTGPDSDYYHEPEYLPAVTTIISDDYLRQYNQNNFRTNGVANYLITITGDFEETVDEETGLTFEESMEEAFQEAGNAPGTAVVFTIKSSGQEAGMDISVTKISDELKEASFEQFRQSNRDEILAAHEVPPGRLGISKDGALGGAVDMERNKQYNNRVVKPLQAMFDNILNKMILEDMEIPDYQHKYKALDIRDVASEFDIGLKAVDKGAMKPIELRKIITDLFKLENNPAGMDIIVDFPELDEFYMVNNASPLGSNTEPTPQMEAIQKNLDEKWVQLISSDMA